MMPYRISMIFHTALHRNRTMVTVPYHSRFKTVAIRDSPIYRDFAARCIPGKIAEVATFHDEHVRNYERNYILENQGGDILTQHTYSNIMNTIFLDIAIKGRLSPTLICWFERQGVITDATAATAFELLPDQTSKRVLKAVFFDWKMQ